MENLYFLHVVRLQGTGPALCTKTPDSYGGGDLARRWRSPPAGQLQESQPGGGSNPRGPTGAQPLYRAAEFATLKYVSLVY